jgi:prepilin signal peptidase PulO-like enzyme (type II secretory pathway)
VLVLEIIYGAVLGAATGSFLGCAAYRLPRRISLGGRSACPACCRQLPAHHNLPVLSWLWLRGRSACCGSPLSPSYLLYELGCTAGGAALALLMGWRGTLLIAVAVIALTYLVFVAHGLPEIRERVELDAEHLDTEAVDGGGHDSGADRT